MRATVDTNLVVSAFLWGGNPSRVLRAAEAGVVDLLTSRELLSELAEVLSRDKFRLRLEAVGSSVGELLDEYMALAELIEVEEIEPISRDRDDDAVIVCAVSGDCDLIISGDKDLLVLGEHCGIRIVTATEFLAELEL